MVMKATIHESASSSRCDNSFNSVTVSFWTDGSSERSLTHRMERSREDDTPLVKQVCVCQLVYLAWCCISSATRLWSAQSRSQLEVCFSKGQEERRGDELPHAGRKGCSLSDNLRTSWKIHEAGKALTNFYALHEYCLFKHLKLNHFLRHCCLFYFLFQREGVIPLMSCHLASAGSSFVLQQIEKAKYSFIHQSATVFPLQSQTFFTKYCWEEKRAHQRITKWKMKVWKCQNSGSFIPQPGNKLLIVSRRWWLIAKTDFCRRNLLYTCRTWTQWLRWWIQPLLHSHSVFCCRSTCAVCCVQSHGLLLRVRESGGREEKQMEGRIWKQGEKHCQRKQEAALFVSVWVCVTDEKRAQPRSEGNY